MQELALIIGCLSLALNVLFLFLLKFTNIMRGPIGYPGPQGMRGDDCKCGKDQR